MILTEKQARVLNYIHEANAGGARPTGEQIKQWRKEPRRRPRQPGELIRAAVAGTPSRREYEPGSALRPSSFAQWRAAMEPLAQVNQSWLQDAMGAYSGGLAAAVMAGAARGSVEGSARSALAALGGGSYRTVPGTPGRPAEYGPDVPREGFLAHLRRLGWVERDKAKTYALTGLGQALLRRYHSQETPGEADAIFLDGGAGNVDYSRLIGRIAELGDAMILDAYLGAEQVRDLLEHTQVTRFLVSSNPRQDGKVAAAGVQLRTWQDATGDTAREIRRAKFHDRVIVSESSVHVLGASLNGVGKGSPTVLYEMPGAAARAMRDYATGLWEVAQTGKGNATPGGA